MIDGITVIDRPSPNHGERRQPIDMLLFHYTGMESANAALDRLCDPAAEVSAHYLIDEDGTLYRLVDEARRAWHAGAAAWAGEADVNSRAIGIELVNPGHEFGYRDFPAVQIAALQDISRYLITKYKIPARRVLGHSDVAPGRKCDPGERFPWQALAAAGIGLWPAARPLDGGPVLAPGAIHPAVTAVRDALRAYGYALDNTFADTLDIPLAAVLAAFQRHFVPECFAPDSAEPPGALGPLTRARLAGLVDAAGCSA